MSRAGFQIFLFHLIVPMIAIWAALYYSEKLQLFANHFTSVGTIVAVGLLAALFLRYLLQKGADAKGVVFLLFTGLITVVVFFFKNGGLYAAYCSMVLSFSGLILIAAQVNYLDNSNVNLENSSIWKMRLDGSEQFVLDTSTHAILNKLLIVFTISFFISSLIYLTYNTRKDNFVNCIRVAENLLPVNDAQVDDIKKYPVISWPIANVARPLSHEHLTEIINEFARQNAHRGVLRGIGFGVTGHSLQRPLDSDNCEIVKYHLIDQSNRLMNLLVESKQNNPSQLSGMVIAKDASVFLIQPYSENINNSQMESLNLEIALFIQSDLKAK